MVGGAEEAGRTARHAVSALGRVPTLLVMVILNVAMIAAATWYLGKRGDDAAGVVKAIIARCMPNPSGNAP